MNKKQKQKRYQCRFKSYARETCKEEDRQMQTGSVSSFMIRLKRSGGNDIQAWERYMQMDSRKAKRKRFNNKVSRGEYEQ